MASERICSGDRIATAVKFFVGLAVRDGGYLLRGVRGWAHPDDVRQTNRGVVWDPCCAQAAEAGMLMRELASAPGATSPEYVYRVTEKGFRSYSTLPPDGISPAGPPDGIWRLYAPQGGICVIQVLRDALAAAMHPRRMNGQPGWLTAVEINQPLREWNDRYGSPRTYRSYTSTDMLHLLALGLVEKSHVKLDGRQTPAVVYRITAAGRDGEVLEWKAPDEDPEPSPPTRASWYGPGRFHLSGGH
jgi:hypothetical protein